MWGIFNIEQTRQEAAKLVQVQSCRVKTWRQYSCSRFFCGGKFTSGGPNGIRTCDLFAFNKPDIFYFSQLGK